MITTTKMQNTSITQKSRAVNAVLRPPPLGKRWVVFCPSGSSFLWLFSGSYEWNLTRFLVLSLVSFMSAVHLRLIHVVCISSSAPLCYWLVWNVWASSGCVHTSVDGHLAVSSFELSWVKLPWTLLDRFVCGLTLSILWPAVRRIILWECVVRNCQLFSKWLFDYISANNVWAFWLFQILFFTCCCPSF